MRSSSSPGLARTNLGYFSQDSLRLARTRLGLSKLYVFMLPLEIERDSLGLVRTQLGLSKWYITMLPLEIERESLGLAWTR